jgi:putative transcriptional regulator
MGIGENLRRIRKQQRFTQTEIARRCGVTPASISGIELGEFNPSAPLLVKIAAALENVSVEDLVEGLPLAPAPEENAVERILQAHGVETRYLTMDGLPDRIQDMDLDEVAAIQQGVLNEIQALLPGLNERHQAGDEAEKAAILREGTEIFWRGETLRWALQARFKGDPDPVEELRRMLATAE